MAIYFTGKYDGPTIEGDIALCKAQTYLWKTTIYRRLQDEATICGKTLIFVDLLQPLDEKFGQLFLDKWSHAKKKDHTRHPCLFLDAHVLTAF